MLPIDPLMCEHRLIERLIKLVTKELHNISETNNVDPKFIDVATDFFRTYTDRCHQGKEEDILFRDLAKKKLSNEHNRIMQELIKEHIYARKTVSGLVKAKESYVAGDLGSLIDIMKLMEMLVVFHPMHIEKEEKRFFYPCMDYFTAQEQEAMLQEFWEFDQKLIHEKYQQIADLMEK